MCRYSHVLKPTVLSGGESLADMIGLLVKHITAGCGGGRKGRTLSRWQKQKGFTSKTFDTENLTVLKHTPDEVTRNARFRQTAGDVLLEAMGRCPSLGQCRKWTEVPEPVLAEVEWGQGSRSSLGIGSEITHGSGLDIWLWNVVAELMSYRQQRPLPKTTDTQMDDNSPCPSRRVDIDSMLWSDDAKRGFLDVLINRLENLGCADADLMRTLTIPLGTPCILLCAQHGSTLALFFGQDHDPQAARIHLPMKGDENLTCLRAMVTTGASGERYLLLLDIFARRGESVVASSTAERLCALSNVFNESLSPNEADMPVLQVAGIDFLDVVPFKQFPKLGISTRHSTEIR